MMIGNLVQWRGRVNMNRLTYISLLRYMLDGIKRERGSNFDQYILRWRINGMESRF